MGSKQTFYLRFSGESVAALLQVVNDKLKQGVRQIGLLISVEREGLNKLIKRSLAALQAGEKRLRAYSRNQFFQTVGIKMNVDNAVFIQGQLTGDEDLAIDGRVEGKIELKDHNLVIGPHGKITAEINAKNVTVIGRVIGDISAEELVEIKSSGSVVGDIKSSQISIADGAHFKGAVDMQTRGDAT